MVIESPCVRLCELDKEGFCTGCGRHIIDIKGWKTMSEAERYKAAKAAKERLNHN